MHDVPTLEYDDDPYEVPQVEEVHAGLVQNAVAQGEDLCVVTPTLRAEYLDYHALAAIFEDMEQAVLVMTPNSDVRDRYQYLGNDEALSQMRFAKTHWPLATVTANGSLSKKTSLPVNNRRDRDKDPQFVYSKYSSRLPSGEDADRIDTVLYDDSVKFEPDRWDELQEWRREHEVSTVVYFVRDPNGPVARRVSDDVDTTWAWTPSAIDRTLQPEAATDGGDGDVVPQATPRQRKLLRQRADGIDYDLQLQAQGEVAEAFEHAWASVEEFADFVDDIDREELRPVVRGAQRTVAAHARLLTKPKYSLKYRAADHKATPHKTRIGRLEQIRDSLDGEAGVAFGPLDDLIEVLWDLRSTIEDAGPSAWKRGAVLASLKQVVDDEESLVVVCPDDAARQALKSDVLIERDSLWNQAAPYVDLHTHRTLSQAAPADHLLLYGPPKKGQRWVLRTCHAPRVTILAYPHELGLLFTQAARLNDALEDLTPVAATTSDELADDDASLDRGYSILDGADVPSLVDDAEFDEGDAVKNSTPTKASSPYDGIAVEIPDEDAVEDFAAGDRTTSSTRSTAGSDDGGLDSYQLSDEENQRDFDDLVEETVSNYRDGRATQGDTETRAPGGSSGSTTGRSRTAGSGGSTGSEPEYVEGLVELQTEDGYAIAHDPETDIEVVDASAGTTVEKQAVDVQPGEMVVVVHDRQAVRDVLEDHLVEAGHFDLVAQAKMWYERLDVEIERHGDDFEDFVEKLEREGLNKSESAYRGYYQGRVNLPKAKATLRAIARAYEMDDVLENFEDVWDANHEIRQLKNDYVDELKKRAHESLTDRDDDEVLDDDLDVRRSDLPTRDDDGSPLVARHVIESVARGVRRPKSYQRRWRAVDD